MRRHHDARTHRERAVGFAGRVAARVGLLAYSGGEKLELPSFGLVDDLEGILGEARLVPAISLGPPRRNRKPVIQLIRPDGEAVGFVKVGWSELTRRLVANEGKWLARLADATPTGIVPPRVLHHATTNDCDVVVTTPLRIDDRAHRSAPLDAALVLALARTFGSERQPVHALRAVSEHRASISEIVDIERLVDSHRDVELEVGFWHGDLTPWNTATRASTVMVWDWEFADDGRPVGFDLLHARFEQVRRAAPSNEDEAIRTLEREYCDILAPAFGTSGDSIQRRADAVFDLYLCELVSREHLLAGEGWTPNNLGDLIGPASSMVQHRLSRQQ